MKHLTAPEIVRALDQRIIGHERAKRTLAIGIRNRWRSLEARRCDTSTARSFHYVISGPPGVGKSSLVLNAAQVLDAPLAQISALQLAGCATFEHTSESVLDSAIERIQSAYPTREQAANSMSTSGMLLIDWLDRLFPLVSADDSHDVQLEARQQAFLRLLGTTSIHTRYGEIQTSHLLIVAETHVPTGRLIELWPELQTAFPHRLDLDTLADDQLTQILSNPAASPIHEYIALLATEGLNIEFTDDALDAIAWEAAEQNRKTDDTGARRLNSVVETVLDDLLFDPSAAHSETVTIDAGYVSSRLMVDGEDEDLADFIL